MLQACLNGARSRTFHVAVPLTPEELARDALACRAAGAAEFHIHPRTAEGLESFAAADIGAAVAALRTAVPGAAIGVSTREGIVADPSLRQQVFAAWHVLPDYVSVNLSEADAPEVIRQMLDMGIGVEAGLATVADAERFVALPEAGQCLRILIEIEEQEETAAKRVAQDIMLVLDAAGMAPPRQLHGFDASQWPLFEMAVKLGLDQRIGLEDGCLLPDGSVAAGNADMIAAAAALIRLWRGESP